jgi:type I restriction enzyme, S subunit
MENIKENNKVSKPGYKHTKLGWIPDDWKVLPLENIGEFSKGKGISKSDIKSEGYPCLTYGDIYTKHHDYIRGFDSFINEESSKLSKAIFGGEILFAGSGETLDEIGKCVAYLNKEKAFAGGDIIIFKPSHSDCLYLSYLLNSNFILRHRRKLGQGHSVVHIYPSGLKTLEIPIPPLSEQQKIAQILSTWDKAIEKTEQLIQAKTQLKKGLMQQLLTGKKRFKEFEGEECKDFALSELVMFLKGSGLSKEKLSLDGHNECILYGELYTTYSEVIDKVISRTNTSEGKLSIEGDILIPASTTTVGIDLATASSLKKSGILLGGDINILRAKNSKYNPDFLAYYLTHVKKFDLASRAQGVTIIHLYGKHFSHVKIMLPSINEQNKIMLLLASIQKEIDLLESQKQQLVSQKKGLMQKLLTGELRINTEQNR